MYPFTMAKQHIYIFLQHLTMIYMCCMVHGGIKMTKSENESEEKYNNYNLIIILIDFCLY